MHIQFLLVGVLVAGSFVYAAWTLMPQVWQRALRASVLKTPLHRVLGDHWLAGDATGCSACSSCAASPVTLGKAAGSAEKTLHFVPRAGRH